MCTTIIHAEVPNNHGIYFLLIFIFIIFYFAYSSESDRKPLCWATNSPLRVH